MAEIAADKGVDPAAIEIWFADEARIGQKNKIARRWAKLTKGSVKRSLMEWAAEGRRGTRPSAPHDQRTASTYIFGAICPKEGKGAALVLPSCNTEAMNLHLAEIATEIAPGRHAILLLDQAGWHLSSRLVVPLDNEVPIRGRLGRVEHAFVGRRADHPFDPRRDSRARPARQEIDRDFLARRPRRPAGRPENPLGGQEYGRRSSTSSEAKPLGVRFSTISPIAV